MRKIIFTGLIFLFNFSLCFSQGDESGQDFARIIHKGISKEWPLKKWKNTFLSKEQVKFVLDHTGGQSISSDESSLDSFYLELEVSFDHSLKNLIANLRDAEVSIKKSKLIEVNMGQMQSLNSIYKQDFSLRMRSKGANYVVYIPECVRINRIWYVSDGFYLRPDDKSTPDTPPGEIKDGGLPEEEGLNTLGYQFFEQLKSTNLKLVEQYFLSDEDLDEVNRILVFNGNQGLNVDSMKNEMPESFSQSTIEMLKRGEREGINWDSTVLREINLVKGEYLYEIPTARIGVVFLNGNMRYRLDLGLCFFVNGRWRVAENVRYFGEL